MNINWAKHGITIPSQYLGITSGNVGLPCPRCNETRHNKGAKSLSVNLGTGMFQCFHCRWTGCAAEKDDEYRPVFTAPKREYKKPTKVGCATLSQRALAWFLKRGIGQETLQDLKVTEGLEWMPQKNKECNTIQFNYYHNGELVNTKFRTGDKNFKLVSGAELIPYNIDCLKGQTECIITEGEMDALTFWECGYRNVVSVPNGANANLQYLDDYVEEYFDDKETIYIASDTDEKGILLRDELLRRFGKERCRVVTYGPEFKDANELLMAKGKEAVKKAVADAPEVKIEGVFTLGDVEENLDIIYTHGLQKGLTLGFENFDNLCSFETKRLCIVTGIPGHGKSEFIDQIAERMNMRYGWRWGFFSPENMPIEYHISKFVEKFTGTKFSAEKLGEGAYKQAKEHIMRDFYFIAPPDNYTLDNILDKARFLVRRRGIKGLVIDPYNRLESIMGSGESETLYISKVLDKLTNFAQINDVLVILMAHPKKLEKDSNGIPECPNLYDIAGSANFYNKADFGLVVHRDRVADCVELHVEKVKFRHLGQPGVCKFKYNINNGRYVPLYEIGEPEWDNSNHLLEQRKEQEKTNNEAARLDFWDQDRDCPF